MASISHCPAAFAGTPVSDVLRSSSSGLRGVPLRALAKTRVVLSKRRDFAISAKIRKTKKIERPWPEDPDPNVKGGVLSHLSHFKPLKEKPKPVTLEFEKPLVDLEKKIIEVRKMADETGLDFSDQILSLENKYHQALKDLYTHLTPIQRVNIARHPNRPTFLDHVFSITEKFVELHGDRAGYDDPAIVTGLGTIDGERYMFIGHQKGRNTKENIQRNFGMPTPHGYRKALRMMYYADHHGFPIVTFIDTPGAYADLKSEELGQGEAIAHNLRTMFGLKVPIISIVIGEGGSGGALAIGCGNKLLMLENSVFYVASPEACAAILWKTAKAAPKAAEKLKITASELCKLQIADDVIPEPLGGAHADPAWTSNQIKIAIKEGMKELKAMNTEDLLKHRMLKFRKIGGFQEGIPSDPKKNFGMKKKDEGPLVAKARRSDLEGDVEKVKQLILKAKESSHEPPMSGLNKAIQQLQNEVKLEFSEAVKALGFEERFAALKDEFSKINSQDQTVDTNLKNNLDKLRDEFNQSLPKAANYKTLKSKISMLKELFKAKNLAEMNQKASPIKQEVNKKFLEVMQRKDVKEKLDALNAEIQRSGASKFDELDTKLAEKVVKMRNELEVEFQQLGMDIKVNENFLEVMQRKKDMKEKLDALKAEIERSGASKFDELDTKLAEKVVKMRNELEVEFQPLDMDVKFSEKFLEVMRRKDVKEKLDALKAEIQRLGASKFDELDTKLAEKVAKMRNELEVEFQPLDMDVKFSEKFLEVMKRKDVKEKLDALKAEIQRSGASKFDELDTKLAEKVVKMRNELEVEFQSLGMDVEAVKSNTPFTVDSAPLKELQAQFEELNHEIWEGMDSIIQLPDVKNKIDLLKLEIANAGMNPNAAARERIAALEQQIKQTLASALESSGLREKHDELKKEIAETINVNGESEGCLETEEEERMKLNVSANSTFA